MVSISKTYLIPILLLFILFKKGITQEIVDYQIKIEVANNKKTVSTYKKILVRNISEINNTYQSFFFTKNDKINFINAHIEDLNGKNLRKIKKQEIKQESALDNNTFYADYFQRNFIYFGGVKF